LHENAVGRRLQKVLRLPKHKLLFDLIHCSNARISDGCSPFASFRPTATAFGDLFRLIPVQFSSVRVMRHSAVKVIDALDHKSLVIRISDSFGTMTLRN